MSISCNENEYISKIFLNGMNDLFLPSNLNENCNEFITESKEDPQSKQPIKFILTKQTSPLNQTEFLQKKTIQKDIDSNPESGDSNNGRWGKEEQSLFAEAVLKYGNDWKKIQSHVSSRNITQVRSHAQKFLMKLKESEFLKDKGLEKNLSWTKVMNFLSMKLTHDELKNVLYSVEQTGLKKNNGRKAYKNLKKIKKNNTNMEINENNENINEGLDSNSMCDSNNNTFFCHECDVYGKSIFNLNEEDRYKIRHKIVKQEEEEKEMLQKIIECFNSSSDNITLNTSFEENSNNEDENDVGFKFINDSKIKYNNNYNNSFLIL